MGGEEALGDVSPPQVGSARICGGIEPFSVELCKELLHLVGADVPVESLVDEDYRGLVAGGEALNLRV
jgi:hypothetical protein